MSRLGASPMIQLCSRAQQSVLSAFCLALPFELAADQASSREGESLFVGQTFFLRRKEAVEFGAIDFDQIKGLLNGPA